LPGRSAARGAASHGSASRCAVVAVLIEGTVFRRSTEMQADPADREGQDF
jgi:hypothetical protein